MYDGTGEIIKERTAQKGTVKVRVHVYETGPAREAEKKLKEKDGREQLRAHHLDRGEPYSEKSGGGSVCNVSCSSRRRETEGRWTPNLELILTRISFCNCRVETRRGWLESEWEEMKWSRCV